MWPGGWGQRALCGLLPPFCPEQRAHVSSRAGRQLGRERAGWIHADPPSPASLREEGGEGSGRVPGMRAPNTPGKQVRVLSALSHENAERGTTCVSGLLCPGSQETAPGGPVSASARIREPGGRCRGESAGQRDRPRPLTAPPPRVPPRAPLVPTQQGSPSASGRSSHSRCRVPAGEQRERGEGWAPAGGEHDPPGRQPPGPQGGHGHQEPRPRRHHQEERWVPSAPPPPSPREPGRGRGHLQPCPTCSGSRQSGREGG